MNTRGAPAAGTGGRSVAKEACEDGEVVMECDGDDEASGSSSDDHERLSAAPRAAAGCGLLSELREKFDFRRQ